MAADSTYRAVVMGTSAGGLYALSTLLAPLTAQYPLPIIIVQHRSKDPGDLLEEVLQTKCDIKIKQADEKEKIKPGTVYIAPPDYHLLIEDDYTFSLTSDEPVSFSRPSIDVLFESAAAVYKQGLTGILLTGSNRDGANGMKAIKAHGGLTIAQSPAEAMFPYMPRNAIDNGAAMHTMTLKEIETMMQKITRLK